MDQSGHKPGAWTLLLAWWAASLKRPVRGTHVPEPADMGTAFGLEYSLGAPLYLDTEGRPVACSQSARGRTACRPASAFIPASVRHRRARG